MSNTLSRNPSALPVVSARPPMTAAPPPEANATSEQSAFQKAEVVSEQAARLGNDDGRYSSLLQDALTHCPELNPTGPAAWLDAKTDAALVQEAQDLRFKEALAEVAYKRNPNVDTKERLAEVRAQLKAVDRDAFLWLHELSPSWRQVSSWPRASC